MVLIVLSEPFEVLLITTASITTTTRRERLYNYCCCCCWCCPLFLFFCSSLADSGRSGELEAEPGMALHPPTCFSIYSLPFDQRRLVGDALLPPSQHVPLSTIAPSHRLSPLRFSTLDMVILRATGLGATWD